MPHFGRWLRVAPLSRLVLQSLDFACRQLDCLRDCKPKDAAAVFVKAVCEGWATLSKCFERIEVAERAKQAKERRPKSVRRPRRRPQRAKKALQEQEAAALNAMREKVDAKTRERLEKQVRGNWEADEFFRARLQAGKLTPQSPDWVKTRHAVLKDMLGKAATAA
jgi:hypothetical protein